MKKLRTILFWLFFSILGAGSLAVIAFHRGESISALWFTTATICSLMISYRFYSKWLAVKVLALDDRRATPAFTREDGKDYVPTNRWIVFGHHFAAIAGPGPLVGPVLAAQFGYLPGTLWILIGGTLAGAVHDAVALFCSMRRGGKSLGQMVREEVGPFAGAIALVAILCIMVILIAVLGLVVVKALAESPWGLFTVAATIPIAVFMGIYLRLLRPGRVAEVSVLGVVLLLFAVWGGQYVHASPAWSACFTRSGPWLAWGIIGYGLLASILPVWLLLAPRDYLSSFMKIGTVILLMLAILWVAPEIRMPKLTGFIFGNGLVIPGKLFPFVFITVACGAISGFHALISTGTTPKLVTHESTVRSVAYGAMITEMAVGIMALIAACALEPGQYFAINMKGDPSSVVSKVLAAGFPVSAADMAALAHDVGEKTLFGRTGGAPTFAVGMAHMFSDALGSKAMMGLWYHFAIMFEALFILTTIDAGTRVGRFLLQDVLKHVWKPLGDTASYPANLASSILFVGAWGWFLYQGVVDPLGGINSLWPIFGIANQLLAVIALSLGTTVLIKMNRQRYVWVTAIPLVFLLVVTMTAGWQKIFHADAGGFLPAIESLRAQLAVAPPAEAGKLAAQLFNNQVDTAITATFMALVLLIVAASAHVWIRVLAGKVPRRLCEDPATPHPELTILVKTLLIISGLLILAPATDLRAGEAPTPVAKGDTIATVVEKLGKPTGFISGKQRVTYYYEQGTIDFLTGRVDRVWLISPDEAAQRTARLNMEEQNRAQQAEVERKRLTDDGAAELARVMADKSFQNRTPSSRLEFWTQFARRYPYTDITGPIAQATAAVNDEQKEDANANELITLSKREGAIQERFKALDAAYAASLANWKRTEINTERAQLKEELATIEARIRELTQTR